MTPNFDIKKNRGPHNSDSVFSSITPQPAAARQEPRPAAAPAATPEQVTALKARLDSLEKHLTELAEKKPAIPAAPGPDPAAALGVRLDSLEKNMAAQAAEFAKYGLALQNTAAAQAAELKRYGLAVQNMAAALDERRKSSELDRRMHEQLESSWARARELEKKLEEAYKISMEAQSKGKEEKKAGAEALAEFGRKAAALEERFSELRAFIGEARAKDEAAHEASAARFHRRADDLEKKISGFGNSLELLSLKGEEAVKQLSAAGAKVDNMAEILGRLDPEKYEIHLKELAGELTGIRQAFKEQADHFWEKFLDFNLIAENFKAESKALGHGLEKVVSGNERLLAAAFDNIGAIIDKALRSFMTGLQEKNREQFARLSANYDGALTTLSKVGSVCSSIEQVSKRLGGYENTLKTFVLQVGGDRLTSLTGVSGIVVRENFGAINAMAGDLKREKEYLEAARKEIADKTSRVLKGDAGAAAETP